MRSTLYAVLLAAVAGCSAPRDPLTHPENLPSGSVEIAAPAGTRAVGAPDALVSLKLGSTVASAVARPAPFPLAETTELHLVATWAPLDGTHLMRVEVRDPNGDLYTRGFVPMSNQPDAPPALSVPGLRHPVRVVRSGRAGRLEGDYRLGIGGTGIARQQRVGAWTFSVFLDDAQTPYGSISGVLR